MLGGTSMSSLRLAAYLPIDRYLALLEESELPDRASGAVLFADISGFTQLTETLSQQFGPRLGSEKLTRYLNLTYEPLIELVHTYRGSVIGFSGDAITCWFGGENMARAVQQAITVALAMQTAIARMLEINISTMMTLNLALKVAVVAGPVRRFVVGDPALQRFDVLAGATLDRLAQAEHLASKGEIVVGPEI